MWQISLQSGCFKSFIITHDSRSRVRERSSTIDTISRNTRRKFRELDRGFVFSASKLGWSCRLHKKPWSKTLPLTTFHCTSYLHNVFFLLDRDRGHLWDSLTGKRLNVWSSSTGEMYCCMVRALCIVPLDVHVYILVRLTCTSKL